MKWRVAWGKESWTEDDLTGRHLSLIVVGLGDDTWAVEPTKGPMHLMAVLAALVCVSSGREYGDVLAELMAAPAAALVDALTVE